MRPEVSYAEPWHGQNQPPNGPRGSRAFWPSGMQPRCVQTPTTISHSGFLTRSLSGCGSTSCAEIDVLGRLDVLLGAVIDEHRLAAPDDGDPLADLDRRQVDAGRRQSQRIGRRVHAVDERPYCEGRADGTDRAGCDQQEVPSRLPFVHVRRRGCHHICHLWSSLLVLREPEPTAGRPAPCTGDRPPVPSGPLLSP